jgi:hypothetical protein
MEIPWKLCGQYPLINYSYLAIQKVKAMLLIYYKLANMNHIQFVL